jgi:hypothetical protein
MPQGVRFQRRSPFALTPVARTGTIRPERTGAEAPGENDSYVVPDDVPGVSECWRSSSPASQVGGWRRGGYFARRQATGTSLQQAEEQANRVLAEAESKHKEITLEAKEEALQIRNSGSRGP